MGKILFLILIPFYGISQEIENVRSELAIDSGKAFYKFHYDIVAGRGNIPVYVQLKIKTSVNEFYAKSVRGDIGEMIYPGEARTFVWDYETDLVHFSGDIDYTIEAVPMITIHSKKVRRGKEVEISVREFLAAQGKYDVVLFRRGAPVRALMDTLQVDTIKFLLPKKVKVGSNYQVGILNGEAKYFSHTFKVKPQVSRFLYVLAGSVMVGAIVLPEFFGSIKPLPEAPNIDTN